MGGACKREHSHTLNSLLEYATKKSYVPCLLSCDGLKSVFLVVMKISNYGIFRLF